MDNLINHGSKTRYDLCKKSIKTYMDKKPQALKTAQKKYAKKNKEDIKEYQQDYHQDYKWNRFLYNTSYNYEIKLFMKIRI